MNDSSRTVPTGIVQISASFDYDSLLMQSNNSTFNDATDVTIYEHSPHENDYSIQVGELVVRERNGPLSPDQYPYIKSALNGITIPRRVVDQMPGATLEERKLNAFDELYQIVGVASVNTKFQKRRTETIAEPVVFLSGYMDVLNTGSAIIKYADILIARRPSPGRYLSLKAENGDYQKKYTMEVVPAKYSQILHVQDMKSILGLELPKLKTDESFVGSIPTTTSRTAIALMQLVRTVAFTAILAYDRSLRFAKSDPNIPLTADEIAEICGITTTPGKQTRVVFDKEAAANGEFRQFTKMQFESINLDKLLLLAATGVPAELRFGGDGINALNINDTLMNAGPQFFMSIQEMMDRDLSNVIGRSMRPANPGERFPCHIFGAPV